MVQFLQELNLFVNRIHPLSPEEWQVFSSIWKPVASARKERLTTEGENEKYLYFVLSGVQRVYFRDTLDREATLVFTYTPSFGGVLDSMLLESESRYIYETITRSEFLRAPYSEIKRLMSEHQNINALIFKGTSYALAGLLERMVELQCYSSEEKFKKMLTRSPHILQQVPHKYLANYIGIDATNFSKFINRIVI